nr:MAG TPA: hypothetical protein [Caudoviricetes sp.]DAV18798.1 MAG TPA: hypothetical protein [Caudoviricetes sp.]
MIKAWLSAIFFKLRSAIFKCWSSIDCLLRFICLKNDN